MGRFFVIRFLFYLIFVMIVTSQEVAFKILRFLPYLVSGMVILAPFYGVYKEINRIALTKIRRTRYFSSKFYFRLFVILSIFILRNLDIIFEFLKTSIVYGFVAFVFTSIVWYLIKKVILVKKKILLPSIFEGYKKFISLS